MDKLYSKPHIAVSSSVPTYFCFMVLADVNTKPVQHSNKQLVAAENKMAATLKFSNNLTLVNNLSIRNSKLSPDKLKIVNQWSGQVSGGTVASVNMTKEAGFKRTPTKSLRIKSISKHPPDAEGFYNADETALVYVPLRGTDFHDLRLVLIKNQKDRDFFFQHAVSLAKPFVRRMQCPNCRQCSCVKVYESGMAGGSEIESKLLEKSLHLLEGDGFEPHFAAEFFFDPNKLKLLPTNEHLSKQQMLNMEARLMKMDKQPKYKGILAAFNKKMAKLVNSDLCIFGNDKRLTGMQQHFIRFSFVGNSSSSTTPVRPISDMSFVSGNNDRVAVSNEDSMFRPAGGNDVPTAQNEELDQMSKVDKSLLGLKKKAGEKVSFNSCLLNQAKVHADILRSFRGWQCLRIIFLGDIQAFFWQIAVSLQTASLQRFFWRMKGLGILDDNPLVELATLSSLFGSSSSPQACENALRGAVSGKIDRVPGCKYEIAKFLVLTLTYVDNLIFASDQSSLFHEGLSLYQIFQDVESCIAHGSLKLQDLTLPYLGVLDPEKLSPEYIKKSCDKVEEYFAWLASEHNRSRVFGGYPEAMIQVAQLSGKIHVLEFLDSYEDAKEYLHQSDKLGHAFTKWETCQFHNVKFANDHGFPEAIKPIFDYAKGDNTPTSVAVNSVTGNESGSMVDKDRPSFGDSRAGLFRDKREKGKSTSAEPQVSSKRPKAKGPSEPLDLSVPGEGVNQRAAPDGYSSRHARHLNQRFKLLEAKSGKRGRVAQDLHSWEQKFLSVKFDPVGDSFSYKLALSFSATTRGVSQHKIATFDEVSDYLMKKDISKRNFLSFIAKLAFDNSGYNSAFILKLRLCYRAFLIEMGDTSWTTKVPKSYIKEFLRGVEQIYKLAHISFPRQLSPPRFSKKNDRVEVICYTDASEVAANYSIYLRHTFLNPGNSLPQIMTILARQGCKIAPLSYVSVPDFELLSFLEGTEQVMHFIEQVKDYYDHMSPPLMITDSLNLCQKLLPNSSIFRVNVASRLEKVKELLLPHSIFDTIAWVRGGSNRVKQANLSDGPTKPFYAVHNLISYDQYWGSYLNKPRESWPVKMLSHIRPSSVRMFSDLLKRYQGIGSRLDKAIVAQAPSEKEIKSDLVNFLNHVQIGPSIMKKLPPPTVGDHLPNCPPDCVLFTQAGPVSEDESHDMEVCCHNPPPSWVLSMSDTNDNAKVCRQVTFLPTTSWQYYDMAEPVVHVERYLPLNGKITEVSLHEDKLYPVLTRIKPQAEFNRFYWRQRVLEKGDISRTAVNATSINPKTKIEKKLKNVKKLSKPSRGRRLSSTKIKVDPDGNVTKFHRSNFAPEPQEFDTVLSKRWNIFSSFSIIGYCLRMKSTYRGIPKLLLNTKVEHQLLKLCEPNVRRYLSQSNHSDMDLVHVEGVFLQRLRGIKRQADFTFRVFLPSCLPFAQAIARYVHLLSCGHSSRRQRAFLETLGYKIPGVEKYFEYLSRSACLVCIRRLAEQQRKELGSIPRVIGQFQSCFSVASCDTSYFWYYRQGKYRERVYVHHFVCLHSRSIFSQVQTDTKTESFLKSLMALGATYGCIPSVLYLDMAAEYQSTQKEILERDSQEYGQLGETRAATVRNRGRKQTKLRRYMDTLEDEERQKMVDRCERFGTTLLFHAAGDSHLSFSEAFIHRFRLAHEMSGFHKLKLDFTDFCLAVRLTDHILNSSPLLVMRDREAVFQVAPVNILMGRLDLVQPLLADVSEFDHSSIRELSKLAHLAQQGYIAFYQLRLTHILEYYNKQGTDTSKVLGRPIGPGDLVLYKPRHISHLRMGVVLDRKQPGIQDYSQSSKFKIRFVPHSHTQIKPESKENLRSTWVVEEKSVGLKSITPLLPREKLYLNFEDMIEDLALDPEDVKAINDDIHQFNKHKQGFHSRLLESRLTPAALSRALFCEKLPGKPLDNLYHKSRPLRFGIEGKTAPMPRAGSNTVETLRNIILPSKLVSTDQYLAESGAVALQDEQPSDEVPVLGPESTASPTRREPENGDSTAGDLGQKETTEDEDSDDDAEIPSLAKSSPVEVSTVHNPVDRLGEVKNLPKFVDDRKSKKKKRRR